MTALDFSTILPELVLAISALGALMAGAYGGKDAIARPILWATVAALLVVGLYVGFADRPQQVAFFGMFTDDAFARFAKVTILISAAAVLAMSAEYMERHRLMRFEYPILIVLATVGMMVMVSAGDLLTLYMGLELQSLALYVVAAFDRDNARSTEAGLKYFVLGSLSSGMLLYGISLVYGFAGTTNLAGVMQAVTAEQLADIAISSARTAAQFGIDPRVAMLSYSTGTSGTGADVDKVRKATELVRAREPDLRVEGPIQYDAAVEPSVAATKMPDSTVAGHATVLIFPDLNTGNNTYKAVQRSAGAIAIGPVLQGLNKPVNDLSRGALVEDIVNTVAITAIQAQGTPR